MNTPVFEMKSISKRFGDKVANQKVDLSLYPGEIHALLGENGAGKTTLMNVLTGIYRANEGEIFHNGKKTDIHSPRQAVDLGIGMVHQHFRLIPTLTVAENVFLYVPENSIFLSKKKMEDEVRECSKKFHLDVDPGALVWQLSVGEQQRVEIIKLLYRGADLLILDEPTAVLTEAEASDLFKILRVMADSGKSVVVISHKMSEVMSFADRITVLRGGRVEDTMLTADATIGRLTRAVTGQRELVPKINDHEVASDERVLEVKDLTVKNDRGVEAVKELSLDVRAGEIFGIAGVAGNGQRELTEAIAGLRSAESGSVRVLGGECLGLGVRERIDRGIAFIPEDRLSTGLVPGMNMEANRMLKEYRGPKFSSRHLVNKKAVKQATVSDIEKYDIKNAGMAAPVSLMSGGNQQKLLIAREVSGEPKLLIAAYPSRGLDIGAADAVHEILLSQAAKGVAVLFISEDLDELFQLSNRIGVMCGGRMMGILPREEAEYSTVVQMMTGESGGERA